MTLVGVRDIWSRSPFVACHMYCLEDVWSARSFTAAFGCFPFAQLQRAADGQLGQLTLSSGLNLRQTLTLAIKLTTMRSPCVRSTNMRQAIRGPILCQTSTKHVKLNDIVHGRWCRRELASSACQASESELVGHECHYFDHHCWCYILTSRS